jgi:hypothetical protein
MNTITTSIRRRLAIASLALAVGLVTACGPGSDPVVDACERLDECNALNAGISVSECIEEVDRFRDDFTASERNDWDRLMEGCLGFDGCGTFLSCVDSNGL